MIRPVHSHWSSSLEAVLWLVEIPVPERYNSRPPSRALERNAPFWCISCLELGAFSCVFMAYESWYCDRTSSGSVWSQHWPGRESLVSLLTKETNSYAKFVPWLVDKLPDCSVSNALLKEQNSLTINCSHRLTNFSLAAKHDSGCLHSLTYRAEPDQTPLLCLLSLQWYVAATATTM